MLKQIIDRGLGLCLVLSVVGMGCLPVPVPFTWYGQQSRTNVDEAAAKVIIPGQTTKEEVVLLLGGPDEISPDGSSLIYHWAKVKFLLLPMFYAPLPEIPKVQKQYRLVVTFDEHGVVTQREVQGSFTSLPHLSP
jgi:outer membrane protein assembly factor BamE (lipoprotein component of BamABCDE complex)